MNHKLKKFQKKRQLGFLGEAGGGETETERQREAVPMGVWVPREGETRKAGSLSAIIQ